MTLKVGPQISYHDLPVRSNRRLFNPDSAVGIDRARGTTLPQRWVLVRRWSSIRSKSSNRSKRFERLKRLERFEPRLSAPGLHLASGIFGLTAESGFNHSWKRSMGIAFLAKPTFSFYIKCRTCDLCSLPSPVFSRFLPPAATGCSNRSSSVFYFVRGPRIRRCSGR